MQQVSLVDTDDSLLIVIDVQPYFIAKLAPEERRPLVQRIAWLTAVAAWHGIPIVVTAEDVARCGAAAPEVSAVLPPGTAVFDKMCFGLAAQADILAAVEASGRRTAVLVGLETDVCVAQSAVGLHARGFRIVVPADAVGSPGPVAQAAGLERLRGLGALMTSVKSLHYEWLRTVEASDRFRAEARSLTEPPPGVVL